MCAILDTCVASHVFGAEHRTDAGTVFLTWVSFGNGRLVYGGTLQQELTMRKALDWLKEAKRQGRVRLFEDNDVRRETDTLRARGVCTSNDPHVIALARISGARVLYTNDRDLMTDFKNRDLLDQPRGKVYPASHSNTVRQLKDWLSRNSRLCAGGGR